MSRQSFGIVSVVLVTLIMGTTIWYRACGDASVSRKRVDISLPRILDEHPEKYDKKPEWSRLDGYLTPTDKALQAQAAQLHAELPSPLTMLPLGYRWPCKIERRVRVSWTPGAVAGFYMLYVENIEGGNVTSYVVRNDTPAVEFTAVDKSVSPKDRWRLKIGEAYRFWVEACGPSQKPCEKRSAPIELPRGWVVPSRS